jgi:hypothetical protein
MIGKVTKKINYVATRHPRMPWRVDLQDRTQEGWVTILEILPRYNPAAYQYNTLWAFLRLYIKRKQWMLTGQALELSETEHKDRGEIQAVFAELQELRGYDPSPEEIATKTGISLANVKANLRGTPLSIHGYSHDGNEDTVRARSYDPVDPLTPEAVLEHKQMARNNFFDWAHDELGSEAFGLMLLHSVAELTWPQIVVLVSTPDKEGAMQWRTLQDEVDSLPEEIHRLSWQAFCTRVQAQYTLTPEALRQAISRALRQLRTRNKDYWY